MNRDLRQADGALMNEDLRIPGFDGPAETFKNKKPTLEPLNPKTWRLGVVLCTVCAHKQVRRLKDNPMGNIAKNI